jgi:hypothetical protein
MRTIGTGIAMAALLVSMGVAPGAQAASAPERHSCTVTTPPNVVDCTYTSLGAGTPGTITVTATTLAASADVYCGGVWDGFAIANPGSTNTTVITHSATDCRLELYSNGTATATAT